MVNDLSRQVLHELRKAGYPEIPHPLVVRALRAGLRRYIVGMDLCGLASICRESQEFDPWDDGD